MEEIGEYRVTRHAGSTTVASGTLLYTTQLEDVAWKFFGQLRPLAGMCLALWKPDGTLLASKSGPTRKPQ
jgi:hypothetical protein